MYVRWSANPSLLVSVVPRSLGPAGYGVFSLALAIVTIGSASFALGGPSLMSRFVPAAAPELRPALARAPAGLDVRWLGAGGHVAGVINPPAAHKYQYWTNDKLPPTVEAWQASATEHPGSWWGDWDAWLSKLSGKKVPARKPGDGKLKVSVDPDATLEVPVYITMASAPGKSTPITFTATDAKTGEKSVTNDHFFGP